MARPRQELAYLDAEVVAAIVPDWPPHFMPSLLCLHDVCSFPALQEGVHLHSPFFPNGNVAIDRARERERASGVSKGFFRQGGEVAPRRGWRGVR